jgi:ribosomal protein L37E
VSYEFIRNALGYVVAIKCTLCGMTSYNPNDIKEKYCGNCHRFHET